MRVVKISNIFWGCLKFLIFFGVNGDAGPEPTYEEKMTVPPWVPEFLFFFLIRSLGAKFIIPRGMVGRMHVGDLKILLYTNP